MTVWGFVSDIHGNRAALDRVEGLGRSRGIDRYVCLGDVVGRGDPDGCVAWVCAHASVALVGNRDLDHLEWISAELRPVVLAWPKEGSASDFVATHGDAQLHPILHSGAKGTAFRRVAALMAEQGFRLWFYGHTHEARVWCLAEAGPLEVDSCRVDLQPERRYVVNVGTTGRPLPRRGGPSFTIYDDSARFLDVIPL